MWFSHEGALEKVESLVEKVTVKIAHGEVCKEKTHQGLALSSFENVLLVSTQGGNLLERLQGYDKTRL